MNQINTVLGTFNLSRYPQRKNDTLRAWDAADEYLLNNISDSLTDNARILIVNDSFGALTVSLNTYKPTVQTDSFLAYQGILNNLAQNNIDAESNTLLTSMQKLDGIYDFILIKLPKSNAYLENILINIKEHIRSDTKIIAAAMAKNIHTSTLKLFENIIGTTTTSLAKKKARLVFSVADNSASITSPYPQSFDLEVGDKIFSISNNANVFSRDKLDIGTRFFLENMPDCSKYSTIVDLGCGNGILGLVAAYQNTTAKIIFTDESYMAVASAKQNFTDAFGKERSAEFIATDCLQGIDKNSVDLILCNPPFHQNHVVGDHIAWQMFNEAYTVLKTGGEFWIVGNHHLAYHAKLKKIFGGYTVVASNKKFAVMFSRKSD